MQIWSGEIKELEKLYDSFRDRLPELGKELEKLIKTDDENILLIYSRRCLEVIITDLCEYELKRPRKTEPLKGIIDKLNREEKVPPNIITSMDHLNSLSVYGAHPKDFDPEQVKPALINLATIIRWYLKYKDAQTINKVKSEEPKYESKELVDVKEVIHKPKKRLIFLLSGLLLVCVIIIAALVVLNIIGGKKQTEIPEKSIAVLPFKLLSDEPDKQYLADGMMDAILLHLSKIEDLRVMSRTSVEKYREPGKTIPEIGRELGVEYLLEGSFQKYGDNVKLIVQLIRASKEGHVWSNEYERNWSDIFSVQSEVAKAIAGELHAVITPEEKQLIEKTPTTSLTAYDFYQRGKELYWSNYFYQEIDLEALKKSENMYHQALEYDSTFALAYAGLARAFWNRNMSDRTTFYAENYLDSALILADLALSYDNHLAEAYLVKANYYWFKGDAKQGYKELNEALKFDPNNWESYQLMGAGYSWNNNNLDFVKAIEYLQKAVNLNHGRERPSLLRSLGVVYANFTGFYEKADYYYNEALKLDTDSVLYLRRLADNEWLKGNFNSSLEFLNKAYLIDSTDINIIRDIGFQHMYLHQYKESFKYFKKCVENNKISGQLDFSYLHRYGYIYWQCGFRKEAEYLLNEQKRFCEESIKLKRGPATIFLTAYYDLAGVYAFLGDKEKAYENLRIISKIQVFPRWWLTLIKTDPLFDGIRNEAEFQNIINDLEIKYNAEHERVRKWMEEQVI